MFKKILFFSGLLFTIYSCTSTDEGELIIADDFDRSSMLENIADNIILPAYEDFSGKMNDLKASGELFTTNPNQVNLKAFRTSWLTAYKVWQHIEMFDIGKAEELQFKFHMNVYPLTVQDVEDNITNGSYDLDNVNNQDAQGFPALDYLLNGIADTDVAILEKYNQASGNNYKKYILDVLNQMKTLTDIVVSDFKAQRNSFVTSIQNNATSAVNKLINDYIFYYEKGLRANKFGIPAGVFSSTPLPEKVEGFYIDICSKELAMEALTAVKNVFEGASYDSSEVGIGFNDYLIKLDRPDIVNNITSQFAQATTTIDNLNKSFNRQITTDNISMTKTYDVLQKTVILLKVDMLQAFNINVDYVDADGD
ncbi:MAG: imelysin family protein [Polaribacter sp.]|nr:imelysin family protein [Polaribacter sp.]MDG2357856.1 imelysin family protein [Polaribacter sp.]